MKAFLILVALTLVALNVADLATGVTMRQQIAQVGEQGRKILTDGFFPKVIHALKVAHEDQHHAPLHNILGGVGDVISSWFSSEKKRPSSAIETNDIRSFSRGRREIKREQLFPEDNSCHFDKSKFQLWLDTVSVEQFDIVLEVLLLFNSTSSAD